MSQFGLPMPPGSRVCILPKFSPVEASVRGKQMEGKNIRELVFPRSNLRLETQLVAN